ncbi:hypothetical protein [Rhodococcus triatomae]|nr:hypothetical protein G419_17876 [Rhodococcus triatomae BKS 15-14]
MTGALPAAEAAGLAYLVRVGGRAGIGAEVERFLDHYRATPALDSDALHADAEVLRSAAAVMRAHLLAQEQAVARLRAAWAGGAADAALATLTRHHEFARADCVAVLAAAQTLDDAGDLIRDAAAARTELVGRMFGQRSPDTDPDGSPAVLTAHATACLTAMTDLIVAVDDIVEEVRRTVESAVDTMCVRVAQGPESTPAPVPAVDTGALAPDAARPTVDHAAPETVAPPAVRDVPVVDGPADTPGAPGPGSGPEMRRVRGRERDPAAVETPTPDVGTGAELAGAGPLAGTDPL